MERGVLGDLVEAICTSSSRQELRQLLSVVPDVQTDNLLSCPSGQLQGMGGLSEFLRPVKHIEAHKWHVM